MKTTPRIRFFAPRNASEPVRRTAQADDVLTRTVEARALHTRWART
jgi:hypothetical protein